MPNNRKSINPKLERKYNKAELVTLVKELGSRNLNQTKQIKQYKEDIQELQTQYTASVFEVGLHREHLERLQGTLDTAHTLIGEMALDLYCDSK